MVTALQEDSEQGVWLFSGAVRTRVSSEDGEEETSVSACSPGSPWTKSNRQEKIMEIQERKAIPYPGVN